MFNGLLLNWSVYVDGANFVGRATQVALPKITPKMQEHFGAGMSAPIDIDTMKVEKMEFTASISGIQKDLYRVVGRADVPIILRAQIRNDTGENENLIAEMRGYVDIDPGEFEPDGKGQTNIKMSVHYYRLSIAGEDVIEIDALNGVRNIAGANQLAGIL
ncbi:phage major tail tube protein [Francisella hispaniensis]|uniref:Phage major tail tube protein n=1 Tax=Francisella hispaniensis TaxID=622488 RepID=F4BFQ1_9GAMM|nr:phage major tail tube protein [Francisella hispaniensis]AEE26295.1 phage major tail tube protein [Francisella hispaniensis]